MTSPPTGQKDVQELARHPATLVPNKAFRNLSLDTISEFCSFEHELPDALQPTLYFPSPQLGSVKWLYYPAGRWIQFSKLVVLNLLKM